MRRKKYVGDLVEKLFWVRALFTGLLVTVILSSCSRPPELIGVENPKVPVASVSEAKRQKVFIATTREATDVAGAFFSDNRAPELGLASVVVSIPPNHVPGELERPRTLPPDPRTEFAVIEPTVYGTDKAFIKSLNTELSKLPPEDRDVLFFVHGYNNTISDSILRLAQFVEDTDYNGIPVLFSWASAAQTVKYVYDLNSIFAARTQLLEAAEIIVRTKARKADVFSHSMGSMLLMEAMVFADLQGRFNQYGRIKSIMLASPDIDIDVFRSQLGSLDVDHGDIFVLTSADDGALGFSSRISGGVSRVGAANADELSELGVTVIDLSDIGDSKSGSHTKFAGSPEVVQLIGKGYNKTGRFGSRSKTSFDHLVADLPILVIRN